MKKTFTLLMLAFLTLHFQSIAQVNTACNAHFSFTINGTTVYFNPASNVDSSIVHHTWVFGDGTAAQNVYAPSHTFSTSGTYIVTQYVIKASNTSNTGIICSDSFKQTIIIPAAPNCGIYAGYSFTRDSLQSNLVHFTNYSKSYNAINYVRWSFGDSTYSTTYSPSHTFTKSGLYRVCLLIKNDSLSSCSADTCMNIQIQVPTVCNIQSYFNSTTDSINTSLIHFHNYTTNLAVADSSYWTFGDSTGSRDINPNHTYKLPGTYNVCLTIKRVTTPGTAPCTSTYCRAVTVTDPCNFNIGYSYKLDSSNHFKAYFTSTNNASNSKFVWSYGDNSPLDSTSLAPSHVYANTGKYNVCLRIQTSANCVKYKCDTVVIPVPVSACNIQSYFNSTTDSINTNLIHFHNYTTNLAVADSSYWTFGDSTGSRDINPNHTYKLPGTYNVCLTIKRVTTPGTAPCTSTYCRTVTVADPCNFNIGYSYKLDSSNHFKAYFTSTNNVSNSKFVWSYGDNSPLDSSSLTPSHVYANAGKYYVCLRIQTSANCVKYKCDSITIPVPVVSCNLAAAFTYRRDSLAVSINTYQFTNTSTPSTGYDSSYWSFGDGSTSHDKNVSHVFTTPGTYTVCLYVKKGTACTSNSCQTIIVPDICNIQPYYTRIIDSIHSIVYFTNTTPPASNAATATWFFGDDSSSTSWSPSHIYKKPGRYYVCLRVQTSSNCVKYRCDSITIPNPPSAIDCNSTSLFTAIQLSSANQIFSFTPAYINTALQYTWTFGDGKGSKNIITSHAYINQGNYTACLTAYRDSNCASTTCKQLTVKPIINCDTIHLAYTYSQDGSSPNKIYFYSNLNTQVQHQYWRVTNLANAADTATIVNQTNLTYLFNDTGYYRVCLNVLTVNGCTKEYCNTIHVNPITSSCELQSYPNPVHTQVSISLPLTAPELIHVYMYSVQGVLLAQTQQQGTTGTNTITLNTATLTSGVYSIQLTYGNNTCFSKFQKL